MFTQILIGDIAQRHDTGGVFKVEKLEEEQNRFINKKISFTMPIYGYNMEKASGLPGLLEDEILEKHGISEELFKVNKLTGTRRIGRVFPSIEVKPHDEGLKFDFFLPKGSYATVLMREFTKKY